MLPFSVLVLNQPKKTFKFLFLHLYIEEKDNQKWLSFFLLTLLVIQYSFLHLYITLNEKEKDG